MSGTPGDPLPERAPTRPEERPDSFYLGRRHDPVAGQTLPDRFDYRARDLTTHAVIVGMTGSGKTGLGIGLIEEAALDGVPTIVVDPKGDMGNLLLHFPGLSPSEFEPWIEAQAAEREGRTPAQQASAVADLWRQGLAEWEQGPERVAALAAAADFAIFTPGSSTGRPLRVLGSLGAPAPALRADPEALTERAQTATAALLGLLGIDSDPVQSRESILIATLLQRSWGEGRDASLEELVRSVQSPPFERLGVLDLETFFPARERAKLALALNALLASPSFAAWLEGEPLDAGSLLWTAAGRPRVSVISIAHLSDRERVFFVSLLLGELLAWMRAQSGTSSLRALFYMDEVFGFFPPSAEPPTKRPMLTLLKQARAYGLGCVLATQNPVDLDYKGLANCGTWFLGRLQTERDKLRVLDGLASLERPPTLGAKPLERADLDRLLSSLAPRVFLAHDVHADGPVLFRTRWVLSYLRGPLTRAEIRRLARGATGEGAAAPAEADETAAEPRDEVEQEELAEDADEARDGDPRDAARVVLPVEVAERWQVPVSPRAEMFRPYLEARLRLHFVRPSSSLDLWRDERARLPLPQRGSVLDWTAAAFETEAERGPERGAGVADPPTDLPHAPLTPAAGHARAHLRWRKQLASRVGELRAITLHGCRSEKLTSAPDEDERAFRLRCRRAADERAEQELGRLARRLAPKIAGQEERVRKAEERLDRETDQFHEARRGSWLSAGANILGALFGRKLVTATNVRRAGSSARAASRAARQKTDVERAQRELAEARRKLEEIVSERDREQAAARASFAALEPEIETVLVRPRKSDLEIEDWAVVWRAE